ncbi:hypothetical protein MD484_g5588, partial [Candolleomyces efflorescens]
MSDSNIQLFNNSQGIQAEAMNFNFTNISSATELDPLRELKAHIAAGAIHDSAERCDAPKCAPETRVAVQDDLYDWIVDGDGDHEKPKKIKWVTGPAGCGKTAIMGSLSERCEAAGILGATFFFSSWSGPVSRRRKTAFVTTIAHQLAKYHPKLREGISQAINENSDVFDKALRTQMEILILQPLRKIPPNEPGLRGAIVIDGVDECEAEQYHDPTAFGPGSRSLQPRTKEQDQLEILQVVEMAAAHPSFPFRILLASRPERVFREFFEPATPTLFARKLDLHEEYNADDDITLFLEAQFSRIRRRYNLRDSWVPPETIRALVVNASGQFIYAATVVRVFDAGGRDPPEALIKAILEVKTTRKPTSNPLEALDMLYSHILSSSPDPLLSVRWIRSINIFRQSPHMMPVRCTISLMNMLLQTDPESSEAEHLLGPLRSLIRIPAPRDQATNSYQFYHKSLLDFLEDASRCGSLYIQKEEPYGFIWDRFNLACANLLSLLFWIPSCVPFPSGTCSMRPTPAGAVCALGIVASQPAEFGADPFYVDCSR